MARMVDGKLLTGPEARVYSAIEAYVLEHGWAPSLDELAGLTGMVKSQAQGAVRNLYTHGLLEYRPNASRCLWPKSLKVVRA